MVPVAQIMMLIPISQYERTLEGAEELWGMRKPEFTHLKKQSAILQPRKFPTRAKLPV